MAAEFEVIGDLVAPRELAHHLALLGGLDVLVRREMIRDENDLVAVEHVRRPGPLELLDRQRRGDVVRQGDVDRHPDDLPRHTLARPAFAARIFSVIVMPMPQLPSLNRLLKGRLCGGDEPLPYDQWMARTFVGRD